MELRLDTHARLWWLAEPERLSTAWEIATRHRLGRLPTAGILVQESWALLQAQGFEPLPVTWRHGLRAGSFPQAELDGITLVTADAAVGPFPCRRLW